MTPEQYLTEAKKKLRKEFNSMLKSEVQARINVINPNPTLNDAVFDWFYTKLKAQAEDSKIELSNLAYQCDMARRDRDKAEKEIDQLKAELSRLQNIIDEQRAQGKFNFKADQNRFTETEISHLQHEVHKITGDGEVMKLFNKLLGNNAG